MTYPIQPGSCFHNRETPSIPRHCWIVISDPNQDDKSVAIVNMTSWNDSRLDSSCIIERGEHPFVNHTTCINYREARKSSLEHLMLGIQKGLLSPTTPVSLELLKRVRNGAMNSRFSPDWIKHLLKSQGLV